MTLIKARKVKNLLANVSDVVSASVKPDSHYGYVVYVLYADGYRHTFTSTL